MTRLPLRTHSDARKTLARFIRQYHAGELEDGKFRALVYAMGQLLGYYRLEVDQTILTRLDELEAAINGGRKV